MTVSRREFSEIGFAGIVCTNMFAAQNRVRVSPELASVKALVFDVFGTVVDWRTSVAREVEELAKRKGLTVDGATFADTWRAGYAPSLNRVRTGELPWTTLDRLHRMTLDKILIDFGIVGLSEAETAGGRPNMALQPTSRRPAAKKKPKPRRRAARG